MIAAGLTIAVWVSCLARVVCRHKFSLMMRIYSIVLLVGLPLVCLALHAPAPKETLLLWTGLECLLWGSHIFGWFDEHQV